MYAAVSQRVYQHDNIADEIGRCKRAEVDIAEAPRVPSGCAAVASLIRRDDVVSLLLQNWNYCVMLCLVCM